VDVKVPDIRGPSAPRSLLSRSSLACWRLLCLLLYHKHGCNRPGLLLLLLHNHIGC
jgi:hypothetical protein